MLYSVTFDPISKIADHLQLMDGFDSITELVALMGTPINYTSQWALYPGCMYSIHPFWGEGFTPGTSQLPAIEEISL